MTATENDHKEGTPTHGICFSLSCPKKMRCSESNTLWSANICFVLQQTTSEFSSVARAVTHVAALARECIAVRSSRTERESDTRRVRMLYLGCCRCAAAVVLLLCCCCASAVLLLLLPLLLLGWFRFLLCVGCWEFELRDLSLYQVCVRPRVRAYESRTTCVVWCALCCCLSLLLIAAVVAGEQQRQRA